MLDAANAQYSSNQLISRPTPSVHHGAAGHPQISENYFLVDGQPKRFFDRASVGGLFSEGWLVRSIEERVVGRCAHPKVLWEVIVERVA